MSIKKRKNKDGTYYYRFEVFKRSNPVTGKQEYYPTKNFKREPGWTDKKYEKEANKAYVLYEAECKAGKVLSKKELRDKERENELEHITIPTLKEFIDNIYLPYIKTYLENKSIVNVLYSLRNLSNLYDYKLNRITRDSIQNVINELITRCKYITVSRYKNIYKLCFQYAVELGIISKNPVTEVVLPKIRKSEKAKQAMAPVKRLNQNEYQRFIKTLDSERKVYKAMFIFMLDTGVRIGEAIALRWENVNLDTGEVIISENVQRTQTGGLEIKLPKNNKIRSVFLTDESLPEMKEWKVFQDSTMPNELCFPSTLTNTYFTTEGIQLRLKRIAEKSNIPHVSPHMLRHTCASRWLEMGMPLQVVSNRLGHSNISITSSIYIHADSDIGEAAAAQFNELLRGKNG